jgi:hypothetical protein
MSTLALPKSSKPTIIISIVAFVIALSLVTSRDDLNLWVLIVGLLVSGFLADLVTGVAHFSFDYVFPDNTPIMGPIAREFRDHHHFPTLDPRDYIVNFSKGAYGSLPVSLLVCALSVVLPSGWPSGLVLCTLLGISFWAFFFHQIHSYAHMGSSLPPNDFKRRVAEISRLPTQAEQKRAFETLFKTVPIPPAIRFLQRHRLILNPGTHNLHHITFESDFSSVNGWSDPLANLILRPAARRMKAKRLALQERENEGNGAPTSTSWSRATRP